MLKFCFLISLHVVVWSLPKWLCVSPKDVHVLFFSRCVKLCCQFCTKIFTLDISSETEEGNWKYLCSNYSWRASIWTCQKLIWWNVYVISLDADAILMSAFLHFYWFCFMRNIQWHCNVELMKVGFYFGGHIYNCREIKHLCNVYCISVSVLNCYSFYLCIFRAGDCGVLLNLYCFSDPRLIFGNSELYNITDLILLSVQCSFKFLKNQSLILK